MTDDIFPRIARVLASAFGVRADTVTPATAQDQLDGWDSLSHIHLVAALEAEFAVAFTMDQALAMTSVAAISAALTEQGIRGR